MSQYYTILIERDVSSEARLVLLNEIKHPFYKLQALPGYFPLYDPATQLVWDDYLAQFLTDAIALQAKEWASHPISPYLVFSISYLV